MRRTLRVTSPYMSGADVDVAQARLVKAGEMSATARDGIYGPVTANATKRAKRTLGYPLGEIVGVYGSQLDEYLSGKRKPSRAMRLRAAARRRAAQKQAARLSVGERTADRMVSWYNARWREEPAGSNYVQALSLLARKLGLGSYYYQMHFAWCAFALFVAALAEGSKTATYGLKQGRFNALFTPEIRVLAERGSYGMSAVAKTSIRKGVAVELDFGGSNGDEVDHIEIALGKPGAAVVAGGKRWVPSASAVVTVGGNTSYEGESGSQSNGGCVAIRVRELSLIRTAFVFT